jgi:hypothetical protein
MYVMKKFYLFSMALLAIFTTTKAQFAISNGVCPGGSPIAVWNIEYVTSGGNRYCILVIDNTWPDAEVIVRGTNSFGADVVIPSTAPAPAGGYKTGLDSSLSYQYDCNAYSAQRIEVTKFQIGTCVSTNFAAPAPLPIKLTGFVGRLETESSVRLDFTSALELNSFQYIVERSADGKTFTNVGTVKAAGNSGSEIKYNFIDQLPGAGAYFYRLKMIDIDGSSDYSKVVYVNSKKGAGIVTKLFPNPFNSEVQLIGATSADLNTPGNIRVFNMSGQQIGFRVVGANSIAIDPSASKGMYFLKFRNSTNTSEQTFKLVKQ